jgi:adenylosuccinate lyase
MSVDIARYSTPEMLALFSKEARFRAWLEVELAVLRVRAERGEIDAGVPEGLIDTIVIDPDEIDRIEREKTGHDVIAFLMHVSPQLPMDLRPHFHRKMTSYDVVDTALSLIMQRAAKQISDRAMELLETLKAMAERYKYSPMIGRTHGVHAEPITFGVKLANWYQMLWRRYVMVDEQIRAVAVCKLSGAVGMYTIEPETEAAVCRELGLDQEVNTQIIGRDIIAEFMCSLGLLASVIEHIAVNIRSLVRTEIREVQEGFRKGKQRGSSAMPHKRNPIGSENMTGVARLVRRSVNGAMETIPSWDERSLDNSSFERINIAEACVFTDYMLKRMKGILERLVVHENAMREHIDLLKGLVYSQDVQSLFAAKTDMPREDAYEVVYLIAQDCFDEDKDFLEALLASEQIMAALTEDELRACFDLKAKIRHVDDIFFLAFDRPELVDN